MTDTRFALDKLCKKHGIRLTDRAATAKAPVWGLVAEGKGMRLCIQDRDQHSAVAMMVAALTAKLGEQQQ